MWLTYVHLEEELLNSLYAPNKSIAEVPAVADDQCPSLDVEFSFVGISRVSTDEAHPTSVWKLMKHPQHLCQPGIPRSICRFGRLSDSRICCSSASPPGAQQGGHAQARRTHAAQGTKDKNRRTVERAGKQLGRALPTG